MSTIAPQPFTTRDGRAVTIRSAQLDDAQACIDYVHALVPESDYLGLMPGDFKNTLEEEQAWIQKHLDNPASFALLATHDDQIIGMLDLRRPDRVRTRHACSFGVSLRAAWRGQGLGTAMMKTMLDWARKSSHIDVIWLGVYATHTRAIALYERLGFQHYGVHPRCFKLDDGSYVDERVMAQFVSDER